MKDTTLKLKTALRTRYKAPAWALLFEVPDGTGSSKSRTADALAMSVWPSRGLYLHGFEVKASRADWIREKESPEKAEAVARYCDFWWLVTEKGVVQDPSEVPDTWGLLEYQGGRLVCKKDAPKMEPVGMDRSFLASLLRCTAEAQDKYVLRSEIQEQLQEQYEEGRKVAEKISQHRISSLEGENAELRKAVADFEKASGIQLGRWDIDARNARMGNIVRMVLDGGLEHSKYGALKRAVGSLDEASGKIREVLEEVEAVLSAVPKLQST